MLIKKNDLSSLHDILCRDGIQDFTDMGGTWIVNPNDPEQRCLHIKTSPNSKVLAVGHCDYVKFAQPTMTSDGNKIFCPQLDDRLGVWLITQMLHNMVDKDKPYDVLLTDNEEKGKSTAILFTPEEGHQYNWMFEFDRHGTDVVMYDYKTKELETLVEGYGFKVVGGSFTDICCLDRLGCAGFNIGTAYYQEHTDKCNANIPELCTQVNKFIKFYNEQYDNHLVGDTESAASTRDRRSWYLYHNLPVVDKKEGKEDKTESKLLVYTADDDTVALLSEEEDELFDLADLEEGADDLDWLEQEDEEAYYQWEDDTYLHADEYWKRKADKDAQKDPFYVKDDIS